MLAMTRAIWGIPDDIRDEKRIHDLIRERCSDPNMDFIGLIRTGVGMLIYWFDENLHLVAVGLELFCQVRRNPVIAEVRDEVHPYIRNASAVFIREGIRQGVFRKRDPTYAAQMLLSLVTGVAMAHVTTRKGEFNSDRLEKEMCDLIIGYL